MHKPLRQMHTLTGRLLFAHGYPRGRRANSGVFSISEPAGAGMGVQNHAESLDSEPPVPRGPIVFYRMRPIVPAFRPKSSMQASSAAEYSQKCTPHPTLGTRSKKTNCLGEYVNEGPSDPARRFRLATFDGVKGGAKSKYVGRGRRARWDGFRRGYSSPKLMPSALASRTRSLWGSTNLSLPATSSSGMWHILPSRRAIM